MQRRPTVGPGSQKAGDLVLVFFINPIGASELARGVSSSNLGTNPSTTPFFDLHRSGGGVRTRYCNIRGTGALPRGLRPLPSSVGFQEYLHKNIHSCRP